MNAVSPIEASAEPAADILALFEAKPEIVLLDEEKGAEFYAACVAEVEAHTPDLTTQKGRDAITSLATKIRNRKAAIDKARLALTSGWRDQTNAVNAAGNAAKATYQALEDKARKPLVDWQAEEDAKATRAKAAFDYLQNAPVVLMADTSETLAARLEEVRAYLLPNEFEAEHRDACERLRAIAIAALTTAIAEAKQAELDRAELARLKADEVARLAAAPAPSTVDAGDAPSFSAPAPAAPPPPPAPAPPAPASEYQTIIILGRAKADLMAVCGLDEPTARRVALALARDQIRHFTVTLEIRHVG